MRLGEHYDPLAPFPLEGREDPAATRSDSPLSDPTTADQDGNLGSGEAGSSVPSTHMEAVTRLAELFESGKDNLDLAIMKVIAEGGSPSAWIAGMLRASLPEEPVEQTPRPRFLGE